MSNEFNEVKYLKFHKQLAVLHKSLQHTEARKAWFGDNPTELNTGGESEKNDYIMVMHVPQGGIQGDHDFATDSITGGFDLMGRNTDHNQDSYRAEEEITSMAKQIGMDVIMRISDIANTPECPNWLNAFRLDSVTYRKIYYDQTRVGYEFRYSLAQTDLMESDDDVWLTDSF